MKKILAGLAFLLAAVLTLDIGRYLVWPDVSRLKKEQPVKTSYMEFREKQWRRDGIPKRIVRRWVPLDGISPYAVKAVIIAEDDKFWSHEGFDFEAIQKAVEKDLKSKKFKAGGSTISQQLARNLYLSPSKNPLRKMKEAILTWRLERNLTKRRIIELYLNVAEWGDGVFGIEAAANRYYGKGSAELTAHEAARLAVILPSPLRYRPGGGRSYPEKRAEVIYGIMVRRGIVLPDYEDLLREAPPANDREAQPEEPPAPDSGYRLEP